MKYDEKRFKSPEKYIEYLQSFALDCVSLNMKTGDSEGDLDTELGDIIPNSGPSLEELILQKEGRNVLVNLIKKHLSPREQSVILARYGFETEAPLTLEEVGKMYKVTRERIRQIEKIALRKLRVKMSKENFRRSDF